MTTIFFIKHNCINRTFHANFANRDIIILLIFSRWFVWNYFQRRCLWYWLLEFRLRMMFAILVMEFKISTQLIFLERSEERRVGKECRSRGAKDHEKKK